MRFKIPRDLTWICFHSQPPRSACAGVEDQRMVFEEYDYNEEEEEGQEEGYFEDVD
jgi:hypothetical protein